MRRWLLLTSALAFSGCNAILDIPERGLAEGSEDSSTASDAALDSKQPDTGADSTTVDSTVADSSGESGDDASLDGATDTPLADTTVLDTAPLDTATLDTATLDTAPLDTATLDTATVGDTNPTDTGPADTGAADTGVADTGPTDTGVVDTGPTCGLAGQPCCGIVSKTTCNTGAVCDSTGNCVASASACVRATDCAPEGKVCAGPTQCSGPLCYSCINSFGVKGAFEPCTSGAQCQSGLCDILRLVCTTPCANAITNDADCAALGANVACTELSVTLSSGDAAVATARLGYCARSCKNDAGCKAGELCRNSTNEAQNRVDITCSPPRTGATKNYGEACVNSNDCKGGACLTFGSSKYCSAFCNAAGDCTGPLPTCGAINLILPKGVGSQTAYMCQP